jgi:heme/copper-type cytochrome/quinol oxidase subunit 2
MFIAIPSFILLYLMDEVVDPTITIKAIGYQWYWNVPFHESDRSATKCIRLVLWSAKLLVY